MKESMIYSCNQGTSEDVPCDENRSCFDGTLYTKIWKHHGSKDILMVMEKYKEKSKTSA